MKKLRLSASSIKDYLECPKRFWYRTYQREKAKVSNHVVFGSIVHEAIEEFDDGKEAVKWALSQWDERMTPEFEFAEMGVPKPPKSFTKMLGNYYTKIVPVLPDEKPYEKELFFEVPWERTPLSNVVIIGKIDLIAGLNIYDWKTGNRKPSKYILQDFQFYLYEWAYEKMYGRRPKVHYGYLNAGELIPINMNDELRNDVGNTIESVIYNIKEENYHRVTGYQDGNCFYRDHCYSEMEVGIGLEY
jgi:CRISPR/Cas system-associated exonuclease Cas4 (RecB family)